MSERVVKFGKFLKKVSGVERTYPWTPFAEKYREILGERLGVRCTVEKFQIRVQVTSFCGMYSSDHRVAVYFPVTSKKKWVVETRARTPPSRVLGYVETVTDHMKGRSVEGFSEALQGLFDYLERRFYRVIFEYNIKPETGRKSYRFRVHRSTGKARILPHKGRH